MQRAVWGVATAVFLSTGCAAVRVVNDGTVVNGVAGTAQAAPGGVSDLSPSETVLLYDGEQLQTDALARPDQDAVISFFHEVKVHEEGSGGCGLGAGLGACFSGGFCSGTCKSPPKLSVEKLAEYDGTIGHSVSVNLDDLPLSQRDRVAVAFHFHISNDGCGKAKRVLLVDALPRGFTPTGVELEDLSSPPTAAVVSSFFPLIIPGIILLATHHGANKHFDDIAWDVKQVGAEQVLVLSANTPSHPLEEGDFFDVKVSGYVPVPHARLP